MLKILREEFVRMSVDFKLYAAALLIILIYINHGRYEHWQAIDYVISYNDELYFIAPALLGLISASSFADDMHSGYYRQLCLRYGVKKYVRAKAVFIMLAPFCVALLCHIAFFTSTVFSGVPLQDDYADIIERNYFLGWALNYGMWWPYMLGGGICLGVGSCLFIAIAAYVSVYTTSRIFIWALPVIIHLFCMISASYIRIPDRYNINMLIRGRTTGPEILLLMVLPTILIMWAFVRAAKRRVLDA